MKVCDREAIWGKFHLLPTAQSSVTKVKPTPSPERMQVLLTRSVPEHPVDGPLCSSLDRNFKKRSGFDM